MRQLIINVPINYRERVNVLIDEVIDADLNGKHMQEGMGLFSDEGHLKWIVTHEKVSIEFIKHK